MDPAQELSAREIVAEWDERRLAHALRDFGEERHAGAIARAIVRRREQAPIETTLRARRHDQLRDPRARPLRRRSSRQARPSRRCESPSTTSWDSSIARCRSPGSLLREGGVLAGIAFHSLEDRRVKRFLAERARGCICPPDLPVCACGREPQAALCARRSIVPSAEEIARNPRAASARLRAARKLTEDGEAPRDAARRRRGRPRARRRTAVPARPPRRAAAGPGASPARLGARPRPRPATAGAGRGAGSRSARRRRSSACSRHRSLDRLIRGRVWIVLIAFALIGIVTLQLLAAEAEREHRSRARARGAAAARERGAEHRKLRTGGRRTRRVAGGTSGDGARADVLAALPGRSDPRTDDRARGRARCSTPVQAGAGGAPAAGSAKPAAASASRDRQLERPAPTAKRPRRGARRPSASSERAPAPRRRARRGRSSTGHRPPAARGGTPTPPAPATSAARPRRPVQAAPAADPSGPAG